jgi:drug/metabolite transporter (DMT)-like permease
MVARTWSLRWSWAGIGLALLGSALWGLAPVATKRALGAVSPDLLSTIRLGVSSLLFYLLAGRGARLSFLRDRWVCLAGIALGLDFVMYSHGLRYTTASAAGLLVTVEPVFTILLAMWLLGERVSSYRAAGSFLTLGGVVLVNAEGLDFHPLEEDWRMVGNLLVMASALAWSVYAVAQRRVRLGTNIFHRLAPIFLVATLMTLPNLLRSGAWTVHADPMGWLMLAILTLFCTSAVYMVYARAQQLIEVSALAVLLSSIPVFSLTFAAVFLEESITRMIMAGAILVTTGVLVIALEPAATPATPPAQAQARSSAS